jgi:hypothetical protein
MFGGMLGGNVVDLLTLDDCIGDVVIRTGSLLMSERFTRVMS